MLFFVIVWWVFIWIFWVFFGFVYGFRVSWCVCKMKIMLFVFVFCFWLGCGLFFCGISWVGVVGGCCFSVSNSWKYWKV